MPRAALGGRVLSPQEVSRLASAEGLALEPEVVAVFATGVPPVEVLPGYRLLPLESALAARRTQMDSVQSAYGEGWLAFAEFDTDCLAFITDVEGTPVVHIPEALPPIVLYERAMECFAVHLLGLQSGALQLDEDSGTLTAEPTGLATAHRQYRHGTNLLSAGELERVRTLVATIDQTPARWKCSAYTDLKAHLYPEAVPFLVDGLARDASTA